jgi:hypothetical protein
MDGELVSVRIVNSDEFDPAIHQLSNKGEVSR